MNQNSERIAARLSRFKEISKHIIGALDYPVSEDEVKRSLESIKSNTATGFDGFPIALLKDIKDEIAPFLSRIFNECLDWGSFPDQQHMARMSSFCKPNKHPGDPASYRTIHVLPSINRVFDGIAAERVYKFTKDYITEFQGGFRKGIGTNEHFFVLREAILSAHRNSSPLCSLRPSLD